MGNVILASAYVSYFGVFPGKYRDLLRKNWGALLTQKELKYNLNFDILNFISNANEVQNWKISGLPDDVTFIENAVFMKYSLSPSLLIDPQDQCIQWIKNMLVQEGSLPETGNTQAKKAEDKTQKSHTHSKKGAAAEKTDNKPY